MIMRLSKALIDMEMADYSAALDPAYTTLEFENMQVLAMGSGKSPPAAMGPAVLQGDVSPGRSLKGLGRAGGTAGVLLPPEGKRGGREVPWSLRDGICGPWQPSA